MENLMISEKELVEILEDKLHFKSTIKTLEEELKKTDTATGYCILRDHIASMKYRLDEIAKQIISKLPKLIEIGKIRNFHKVGAKLYLFGEDYVFSKTLDYSEHKAILQKIGRNRKNMKIYVEIVDDNKKDKGKTK